MAGRVDFVAGACGDSHYRVLRIFEGGVTLRHDMSVQEIKEAVRRVQKVRTDAGTFLFNSTASRDLGNSLEWLRSIVEPD